MLVWTESITETWVRFHSELKQQQAPSTNAICQWVRQWCEEGSVTCKRPAGQPSSFYTPENTAWMSASKGHSPRQSTRKRTWALGTSNSSVRRILHSDLNLHPYNLQTVHSLRARDKEVVHLQFFRQFQGILNEDPDLPNNLLVIDQTHFHLHDTVDKQNLW
jgi:hypothetical protein